ncbi:hypothetical protein [Streptomyces sp. SAI-090]|nr:hypothetical protein [Streptomyces sp. SAI-090]
MTLAAVVAAICPTASRGTDAVLEVYATLDEAVGGPLRSGAAGHVRLDE